MKRFLFLMLSCALLPGCEEKREEQAREAGSEKRITTDEVLASAREALGKTTAFLDQERKDLAERLEKEAIVVNEKIQQLKEEAPEKMAPVIAELEKQRDELVRVWGQVRQLSSERVEQLIERLHHGWKQSDFDSTLEKENEAVEKEAAPGP